MSQETHPEDRTILAAIEALERGGDTLEPGARPDEETTETTETLARLYTEVLGLIPQELDPAPPRPEVKQRLMTAIGAGPAPQGSDIPQGSDTPQAVPQPVPAPAPAAPTPVAAPPTPADRPSPEAPVPVSREVRVPARPARQPGRWPLLLAASLALAFAGLSGWLYVEWRDQEATIAQLEQELASQRRDLAQAREPLDNLRAELASLREKLDLVTTPAVEVSPLRPEGGLQPGARGLLFVAADHQHWYLNVEGLQPAGGGKVYQLWWMASGGPVSGGTFIARPGERIELSSETMPAGTTAAVVTLEDAGGAPAPTGPAVLRSTGIRQLS